MPAAGPPIAGPSVGAAEVAAAVLAHRDVVRLDGGPFGTVATHLPGRGRVLGVRVGIGAEPVELALVARLGSRLPELADQLATVVRGLLGPVPVEVTVTDLAPAADVPGGRPGEPVAGGQAGSQEGPEGLD